MEINKDEKFWEIMIQNVGVVWFTNFLMTYFKNGPIKLT
jgi:hypothetical protein